MARAIAGGGKDLASAIRQQSRTTTLRNYTNALAQYKVAKDLPDHLQQMLRRLEKIELADKKR